MLPCPKQSAARLCASVRGCGVLQQRGRDIQACDRRADEFGRRARDVSAPLVRREPL